MSDQPQTQTYAYSDSLPNSTSFDTEPLIFPIESTCTLLPRSQKLGLPTVTNCTYREMTHWVTFWPFCKHFSGLGSFFLQSRKALFSAPHLDAMCFDEDINTAEVVIGALSTESADTSMVFRNSVVPFQPALCPNPRPLQLSDPREFTSVTVQAPYRAIATELLRRSRRHSELPSSIRPRRRRRVIDVYPVNIDTR